MELSNALSSGLTAAGAKAALDASCKRLLSEKIILGWILHSCLAEYRDCTPREIAEKYIEGTPLVSQIPLDGGGSAIRGRGQESLTPEEGGVFFDICFDALAPGTENAVQLIVNVEGQNRFYPGYPLLKRGIFYGSRLLSAQDGTVFAKSHYEKLRKVYSIWICMKPPRDRENTITLYHMTEENLIGEVQENERNYDLLSIIMVCLGSPGQAEERNVLKLLSTLFSKTIAAEEKKRILREEFQIPMTVELEKEVTFMCNFSEGIWEEAMEKGLAKGMEKGMEKGLEEGRERGKAETLLLSLKNLVENTGWTLEKAMDMLNIPSLDRPKYTAMLQ